MSIFAHPDCTLRVHSTARVDAECVTVNRTSDHAPFAALDIVATRANGVALCFGLFLVDLDYAHDLARAIVEVNRRHAALKADCAVPLHALAAE